MQDQVEMTDPESVQDGNVRELAERLVRGHAADQVELLNGLEPAVAAAALDRIPAERAIEILDEAQLDAAPDIVRLLQTSHAARLLSGMSADRVAEIFRQLGQPDRDRLIASLDADTRAVIERLLTYPPFTAGSIMTTEFVSAPSSWTVQQTLDHVRQVERTRETIYAIYVIDPQTRRLLQAVPLRRLISADPSAPLLSAARTTEPIKVGPATDREEVARLFRKYDLLAVPVVDQIGHLLGIVTVDDAIDAILEETSEDVQKFGGMAAIEETYFHIGFGKMIKKRAGWLCALFLSEMLTASAMQGFQAELEKAIVLALFIPLIMSSGGNSGSQATSLLIRALALREMRLGDWWRVALRELPTGIVLGSILGVIGIARITLWQKIGIFDYGEHWPLIAITVGAALVGVVTFGSLSGSMLPFVLQRLGFDPASASAPFVATLVDVTGLLIYFSVANLILNGRLF